VALDGFDARMTFYYGSSRRTDLVDNSLIFSGEGAVISFGKLEGEDEREWSLFEREKGGIWNRRHELNRWVSDRRWSRIVFREGGGQQPINDESRAQIASVVSKLSRPEINIRRIQWREQTETPVEIGPISGGGKRVGVVRLEQVSVLGR